MKTKIVKENLYEFERGMDPKRALKIDLDSRLEDQNFRDNIVDLLNEKLGLKTFQYNPNASNKGFNPFVFNALYYPSEPGKIFLITAYYNTVIRNESLVDEVPTALGRKIKKILQENGYPVITVKQISVSKQYNSKEFEITFKK
ncbi:MAG: hypothetical protein ACOC3V_04275 [bacterium]